MKSLRSSRFRLFACWLLLLSFWMPQSPACPICSSGAANSMAPLINEADWGILVRLVPAPRHAQFTLHEKLWGSDQVPPLHIQLDPETKRHLELSPSTTALCLGKLNGNQVSWKCIGLGSPEVVQFVQRLRNDRNLWTKDDSARAHYFLPLLQDPNGLIQATAHAEIARTPYHLLRTLKNPIPKKDLLLYLDSSRHLQWHPLYILLLASVADDNEKGWIKQRALASTGNLYSASAWMTAWIEIDPKNALPTLLETHLPKSISDTSEVTQSLALALSVQATAQPSLRPQVLEAYQLLLQRVPRLAPPLVTDLIAWKELSLQPEVSKLLEKSSDLYTRENVLLMRSYLQLSPTHSSTDAPAKENHSPWLWLLCLVPVVLLIPKLRKSQA